MNLLWVKSIMIGVIKLDCVAVVHKQLRYDESANEVKSRLERESWKKDFIKNEAMLPKSLEG